MAVVRLLACVLAATVVAGCTAVRTVPTSKTEVQDLLVTLEGKGVRQTFPEEFRSFEAVYAEGEALFRRDDFSGAERHFRLALLKGMALEKRQAERPQASLASPGESADDAADDDAEIAGEPEPAEPAAGLSLRQELPPAAAGAAPTATDEEVEDDTVAAVWQPPPFGEITGGETTYAVRKGETLRVIAARFGVSRNYLARLNGIDPHKGLMAGRVLKINTRRIVPKKLREGLVINIPDRTLYLFKKGKLSATFPVAVGKPQADDSPDWRTPTGSFRIVAKEKDPTWRVPLSIRKEMEEEGKEPLKEVLPGPKNPLGKYALRTSIPGIMIHGTTEPASIYGYNSHGCIRVFPSRMEELFRDVKLDSRGEIIYRPVKLAVADGGKVYLEVHDDTYRKVGNLTEEVRKAIRGRNLSEVIDWEKVDRVLRERYGIAEEVSL